MSLLGDVFKIGSKLISLIPGKKKPPGPIAIVTRDELYKRGAKKKESEPKP